MYICMLYMHAYTYRQDIYTYMHTLVFAKINHQSDPNVAWCVHDLLQSVLQNWPYSVVRWWQALLTQWLGMILPGYIAPGLVFSIHCACAWGLVRRLSSMHILVFQACGMKHAPLRLQAPGHHGITHAPSHANQKSVLSVHEPFERKRVHRSLHTSNNIPWPWPRPWPSWRPWPWPGTTFTSRCMWHHRR